MTKQDLSHLVDLFKALSHPVRLRILALLRDGEHCVCQITETLELPASTASEHLAELRRAGLLSERKEGRWVYYDLSPREDLEAIIEALHPNLDGVAQIRKDLKLSQKVRKAPIELTCGKGSPCRTKSKEMP